MSSPSVHNSGSARPAAGAPDSAEVRTQEPSGSFNEQKVALVASKNAENPVDKPDNHKIDQWKHDRPSPESPAASASGLKDAAESARSQGLLARLRTAVKSIINFFVRGLSPSAQPEASLQTLVNQQRLTGLADASKKIGAAVQSLENPRGSNTLAVINQTARKLNLPNSAAVKAIAHPPNVQHVVENANLPPGTQVQLQENFQQAASLLEQVYAARPDLDALKNNPSFAQIFEDAAKKPDLAGLAELNHAQDRTLRNWLVHSLNLVDQCAQVMADATAGKDSKILGEIKTDVHELVSKPADRLPFVISS